MPCSPGETNYDGKTLKPTLTHNEPVHPNEEVDDGGDHESHHEQNHDGENLVVVEIERQSTKDLSIRRTFPDAVDVRLTILTVESQASFAEG